MNSGLFSFPSILALGSGTLKAQEFLTSGVWKKPANVKAVLVILVGGGGGGGGSSVYPNASGVAVYPGFAIGGSSSQYVESIIPVTGDLIITIGIKGLGGVAITSGASIGNTGSTGGDSTIIHDNKTVLTSKGGLGGEGSSYNVNSAAGLGVSSNMLRAKSLGMSLGGNSPYRTDASASITPSAAIMTVNPNGESALSAINLLCAGGAGTTTNGAIGGSNMGGNSPASYINFSSGSLNGGNAIENTGSGGGACGGGNNYVNDSRSTPVYAGKGGDGADGYCLLMWME